MLLLFHRRIYRKFLSMASIKHSTDKNGRSIYYVHWRDEDSGHGRRRIFKNVDDAAYFFWLKQDFELNCRSATWSGIDKSWSFQKLLMFFLGYQASKLEKNIIRASTYSKCRHDLLAVEGAILKKNATRISHRDITESVRPGCQRWIRSAYFLLVEKRLITFNPVDRLARQSVLPAIFRVKLSVAL